MAAGDDFRRFRYEEQGPASPAEPPQGRLIAIVSPKGGVGKTFLAVNLAVLFSERSRRVALLDLDLAAGDIGLQLDLLQGPTIVDLLPYLEGMEPETLDRFVTHYKTGLKVLLAPPRPELADMVSPADVAKVLDLAPSHYSFVFIDTPSNPANEVLLETLERSHRMVLVLTQDVGALRRTRLFLNVLERLGLAPGEKIIPVLNMASRESPASTSQVMAFLGLKGLVLLADDRPLVDRTVFNGQPLVTAAREAQLAKGVLEVAQLLSPDLFAVQPPAVPKGVFLWPPWRKKASSQL